jgi:hypothetical protein
MVILGMMLGIGNQMLKVKCLYSTELIFDSIINSFENMSFHRKPTIKVFVEAELKFPAIVDITLQAGLKYSHDLHFGFDFQNYSFPD